MLVDAVFHPPVRDIPDAGPKAPPAAAAAKAPTSLPLLRAEIAKTVNAWERARGGTATPARAAACTPAPRTRAELDTSAERVQKAGNPQAKVQVLARELQCQDAPSRASLMALLAKREHLDSVVPSDWLNPANIAAATTSGKITRADQGLIVESFAAAYNRGAADPKADPATIINHNAANNFLDADTPFGEYYNNVNTVNAVLNSGARGEMDRFVSNWSQREIGLIAIHDDNSWSPQQLDRAMHVLAGAGNSGTTIEVFDRIGPQARQHIYGLMRHVHQPADDEPRQVNGWASSDDSVAILLQALGSQPGKGEPVYRPGVPFALRTEANVTTADTLALEFVRFGGQHQDLFLEGQDAHGARAEGLADTMLAHEQHLFGELSNPRFGQFTQGSSSYSPEALRDVLALGTALRATTLSAGVPAWKQQAVQTSALNYARTQITSAPGPDAAPSPTGRTGMMLMAMQDAVKQGYKSLEDQRAGQERVVGFFTDILVDRVAKGAGKLTPEGALAEVVGGQVIDLATDKGKAFLRQKITDFLFGGFDSGKLDGVQQRMNTVVGAFVQSLPDGVEIDIGNFMNAMSQAINKAR
jgi:hypothetical protein